MKNELGTLSLLWLLCAAPSRAFVNAAQKSNLPSVPSFQKKIIVGEVGRGGNAKTDMAAAGSDFSEAAKMLFGNLIGPASMLTGGLVPLGFLAEPLDDEGKPWKKRANNLYRILSVISLAHELTAIMYATVACNKLTEAPVRAAPSVFALIKRDFELPWIGANLHFMSGLIGFVGMVMLRALMIFPHPLNSATAGLASAFVFAMISIINVGISEGDGRGDKLGGNLLTMGIRYFSLLVQQVGEKRTFLGGLSLLLFLFYGGMTVRTMLLEGEKST